MISLLAELRHSSMWVCFCHHRRMSPFWPGKCVLWAIITVTIIELGIRNLFKFPSIFVKREERVRNYYRQVISLLQKQFSHTFTPLASLRVNSVQGARFHIISPLISSIFSGYICSRSSLTICCSPLISLGIVTNYTILAPRYYYVSSTSMCVGVQQCN